MFLEVIGFLSKNNSMAMAPNELVESLDILGYQSSEEFDEFFEHQKVFLNLDTIKFIPMRKHPNQGLYGTAYGTILLSADNKVLNVYLNPKRFKLHPTEERAKVAEVTTVHEILHQWTKIKGYPQIRGDNRYLEVVNWFTNVFHHLVINKEMDRLSYEYNLLDRFVADEFVDRIEKQKQCEVIPTYPPWSIQFSLYTLWFTNMYFQFSAENYEKVRQLMVDSNANLLKRSDRCIKKIVVSNCWKSPSRMFYAMKQVRELIEFKHPLLEIRNPDTSEWC